MQTEDQGFVCDEMLKKLTRWLRIAGYNVISPSMKDDGEIAKLSIETDRVLITRDKDLSKRKGPTTLLMISDDLDLQLEEIKRYIFTIKDPRGRSRCPLCNGDLSYVKRAELTPSMIETIPGRTLSSFDTFFICCECNKIYWKGSHWNRIIERLSKHSMEPHLPDQP
ncbi:MAG: Mut7-C RNAse domain-containing protein [Candidatus Thermoplasmatota archaeon]|nr:Mut7-C RNAse domain-containing protein [Candidatus Thermoplasmatota archaeon]